MSEVIAERRNLSIAYFEGKVNDDGVICLVVTDSDGPDIDFVGVCIVSYGVVHHPWKAERKSLYHVKIGDKLKFSSFTRVL